MSVSSYTERIFSELDRVRIQRLASRFPTVDSHPHTVIEAFDEGDFLMPREIPADVITVNSRLQLRDQTGELRQITLCYPHEADLARGFLSVLSPIGGELLGRRVGETVNWTDVDGKLATLKIDELLFQPEANGEFAL